MNAMLFLGPLHVTSGPASRLTSGLRREQSVADSNIRHFGREHNIFLGANENAQICCCRRHLLCLKIYIVF